MGHLCHIFLGPPSVDGHWGFCRVMAMATSAAVRTAAYGPLNLCEVCSLRVCTQDGLCSVRWELSLVLMKSQATPCQPPPPSHPESSAMAHPRLDVCS